MKRHDDFNEGRIKHLEFIQAVISRLGNDAFLMKGWALTVAGAFLGFAVTAREVWLAVGSVFTTLVFWRLDAYFLRAERLFRRLYSRVRDGNEGVAPFFMNATSPAFTKLLSEDERNELSLWAAFRSASLWWFYFAIQLAAVVVVLVLALNPEGWPAPMPSPSTSP